MNPAAYAVIDSSALRHNLKIVRRYAPHAKVMAVIKANGYGHGLVRVAKALRDSEAFAVARVDEGIQLREAGIEQPIAVLEGFINQEELDLLHRFDLAPVLHCEDQLSLLESIKQPNYISAWLKLDTGMHRLGFKAEEAKTIKSRIDACQSIAKPVPLMTHLANADDLDDSTTHHQLELFRRTTAAIDGERSIANSAGILAWKRSVSDWVRPGIMLFGASPFPGTTGKEYGLETVMTLKSKLIAIKDLHKGDAVGYGGLWICPRPMRLGVIAIGYGDGYPRQAQAQTPVLIQESRVPLIGRVSMDMITVDLTNCSHAKMGDSVELWGSHIAIEEIADHASTIPYILLCGITQRVMIKEEVENPAI